MVLFGNNRLKIEEQCDAIQNFITPLLTEFRLKAHSHQIKIATDWLQTGSRLTFESNIGVNGTMLYQCNPTAFCQSEANLKPVGS